MLYGVYVKRSVGNVFLLDEPGNVCALFAAGLCLCKLITNCFVHYYDASLRCLSCLSCIMVISYPRNVSKV